MKIINFFNAKNILNVMAAWMRGLEKKLGREGNGSGDNGRDLHPKKAVLSHPNNIMSSMLAIIALATLPAKTTMDYKDPIK